MKITNILMIFAVFAGFKSAAPMFCIRYTVQQEGEIAKSVSIVADSELATLMTTPPSSSTTLDLINTYAKRFNLLREIFGGFCEQLTVYRKVLFTKFDTEEPISENNIEGHLCVSNVQKDDVSNDGFVIDARLKREFIELNGESFFAYYTRNSCTELSFTIIMVRVYKQEGECFNLHFVFVCYVNEEVH